MNIRGTFNRVFSLSVVAFAATVGAQEGGGIFLKDTPTAPTVESTGTAPLEPGSVSTAEAKDPRELRVAKLKYQVKVTELQKPISVLIGNYQGQLEKMSADFQANGDLDGVVAMKKEIDAIKDTGVPAPEIDQSSKLAPVRKIYESARAKLEVSIASQTVELNGLYKTSLEQLKSDLMKEGRLDDAMAVINYLKTVPEANDVSAANGFKSLTDRRQQTDGLTVRVQVDGLSHMYLQGDKIWFDHTKGKASAPGRHNGEVTTVLNGEMWMPVWNGKVTEHHDCEIGLPDSGDVKVTYRHKEGRGHAEVIEQPTEANNYTAKIELRDQDKRTDKGFWGSEFMEFDLRW